MAREYDPDRPQVDDNNDFATPNAYSVSVFIESIGGFTYTLFTLAGLPVSVQCGKTFTSSSSTKHRYVHPVTGRRSDAASRYLYPHAENPNLTILVGKRVKRIIIEYVTPRGLESMD